MMWLIAEEEGEIKNMLERLERYLDKKGLELNVREDEDVKVQGRRRENK